MKDHKKAYGLCPASMTIWNADQTYNKTGMEKYLTTAHRPSPSAAPPVRTSP